MTEPAAIATAAPLAFAQQYLWFLLQYPDSGPARFNANLVIEWFGELDARILGEALAAIENRHEALRTRLRIVKGHPMQLVVEPSAEATPFLDLSHLPKAEREAAFEDVVREEERRPLDLARGPTLRKLLVRLGPDEHVLLWTASHANVDAWSLRTIVRELRELYTARARERPARLPPLPTRYIDCARAQRTTAPQPRHIAFWRASLGDRACYEPPHRQPRPARASVEQVQSIAISPELNARIDATCRALSCTRFSIFFAAFGLVAHRWSGTTDLVALIASAQRDAHTEHLVGSLADVLPIRLVLSPGHNAAELVRAAQTAVLAGLIHEMPLRRIEEATGRTYRFTFAITDHVPFQQADGDPGRRCVHRPDALEMATGHMADIAFRASSLPMRLYRMDLVFLLRSEVVVCAYQPDLFSAETIEQVLRWLLEALETLTQAEC